MDITNITEQKQDLTNTDTDTDRGLRKKILFSVEIQALDIISCEYGTFSKRTIVHVTFQKPSRLSRTVIDDHLLGLPSLAFLGLSPRVSLPAEPGCFGLFDAFLFLSGRFGDEALDHGFPVV